MLDVASGFERLLRDKNILNPSSLVFCALYKELNEEAAALHLPSSLVQPDHRNAYVLHTKR